MFFKKRNTGDDKKLERITNKTIEQHRREILESAKRFKYPVQYEKHRLVINATLIGIMFVVVFFTGVAWRLYLVHDTNDFLYKITQIIPFNVGKIDDQAILYSDYLAYYRSAWHYHLNKDISAQTDPTEESEKQLSEQYSEAALVNAAKIALAKKIAQDKNITITSDEIDSELKSKLVYDNEKMSIATFNSVVRDYYGLDQMEYRQIFLKYPLLLRKVVYEIDDYAKESVAMIYTKIKESDVVDDFESTAKDFGERGVTYVDSGLIAIGANDGGLSEVAINQTVNSTSEVFVSYNLSECNILRLVSKDDETVRYQVMKIPLTAFNQQFNDLLKDQKIKDYIGLDLNKK